MILGILWGLYVKNVISIYFFILALSVVFILLPRKLKKYVKLILKKQYLIIFCIVTLFSYGYFNFRNQMYETTYQDWINSNEIRGIILSNRRRKKLYGAIYTKIEGDEWKESISLYRKIITE